MYLHNSVIYYRSAGQLECLNLVFKQNSDLVGHVLLKVHEVYSLRGHIAITRISRIGLLPLVSGFSE